MTSADGESIPLPTDNVTPDQVFERQYAQRLVNEALDRLGGELRARGREKQFDVLRGYLEVSTPTHNYEEAGRVLGMREGAVKVAVHRLRERYRQLPLEEVRRSLLDPDDAADEIDQLLAALSGP